VSENLHGKWDSTINNSKHCRLHKIHTVHPQCCNLALSLPISTNSSARVVYGMLFRSVAKILGKGVAPPPEI
jgi:hypothetical protein